MGNNKLSRRDMLKALGLGAVTLAVTPEVFAKKVLSEPGLPDISYPLLPDREDIKPSRPVNVIVLGAGGRGWNAYSPYGLQFPDEFKVVGVAEPIPYRRERISKAFNIPPENQFET